MLVMYTFFLMCKELTVYQDCIWYISCEYIYMYAFPGLYMPQVGSRQASLNKLFWCTILCYLLCSGEKMEKYRYTWIGITNQPALVILTLDFKSVILSISCVLFKVFQIHTQHVLTFWDHSMILVQSQPKFTFQVIEAKSYLWKLQQRMVYHLQQ